MKKPTLLIVLLATLRLGAQNKTNHWFWGNGHRTGFYDRNARSQHHYI